MSDGSEIAPPLHAISSGGGVQSTALCVLDARGVIDFGLHLFANVGEHAENPETLEYVRDVLTPYAARNGIEFREVQWTDRKGNRRDLYDDLLSAKRDIAIPMRLASGAFANRKCTGRYKIEVVARELKKMGATPAQPAVVGIGISTDEYTRAKIGVPKEQPWTTRVNPLLDLRLSRDDCYRIVADEGLPEPPKSSCHFCPFQSAAQWRHRRDHQPELFAVSEALEVKLNERRESLGRDRAGLASARLPLREAIDDPQILLDIGGVCDTGSCMT